MPAQAARVDLPKRQILQLVVRKVPAPESEQLLSDVAVVSRAAQNFVRRHAPGAPAASFAPLVE